MNHVEHHDINKITAQNETIERIINAKHIESLLELKRLIRSIDQLIQNIIIQILSASLSQKGAQIKIVRLLELIEHCKIGDHPTIKSQITRLKNTFKLQFGKNFTELQTELPQYLNTSKIQHYVETIADKHDDPQNSAQPNQITKPLIQTTPSYSIKQKENIPPIKPYYQNKPIFKHELSKNLSAWPSTNAQSDHASNTIKHTQTIAEKINTAIKKTRLNSMHAVSNII